MNNVERHITEVFINKLECNPDYYISQDYEYPLDIIEYVRDNMDSSDLYFAEDYTFPYQIIKDNINYFVKGINRIIEDYDKETLLDLINRFSIEDFAEIAIYQMNFGQTIEHLWLKEILDAFEYDEEYEVYNMTKESYGIMKATIWRKYLEMCKGE